MRLFIIFIFLTFVVLENSNAAPQSTPTKSNPINNKNLVTQDTDDYFPPDQKKTFKLQFGGIAGEFNGNDPKNWHYLIAVTKKSEFEFERFFMWGISLISNQSAEAKVQVDGTSLFQMAPEWSHVGIGLSQFIWGQDGISNLININQTKITTYADLGPYFQIQAYYGLRGLAYSLTFQSWF